MITGDEKYVALTTFRKNGERKATPIWIAPLDGELGFTTGSESWKLKRIRNDPRCELQPCNSRGVVAEGAAVATGKAREASPEEFRIVRNAIRSKYGIATKLIGLVGSLRKLIGKNQSMSDTAVLITLD